MTNKSSNKIKLCFSDVAVTVIIGCIAPVVWMWSGMRYISDPPSGIMVTVWRIVFMYGMYVPCRFCSGTWHDFCFFAQGFLIGGIIDLIRWFVWRRHAAHAL